MLLIDSNEENTLISKKYSQKYGIEMTDIVTLKINENVAEIMMNDGKANVLSHSMFDQLNKAFDAAEKEKAIVILKGRVGLFSGGFDLKELSKGPKEAIELTGRGSRFARRILSFPTPVIGLSTGHCIAMGAFLMLACDYRVGIQGQFKIGLNETLIGMTMHDFGIELARYRIPLNYFNRSVINAELYTPSDAIEAGFYDTVSEIESIETHISEIKQNFKNLNMSAFAGTKIKSRRSLLETLDECIENDMKMAM